MNGHKVGDLLYRNDSGQWEYAGVKSALEDRDHWAQVSSSISWNNSPGMKANPIHELDDEICRPVTLVLRPVNHA